MINLDVIIARPARCENGTQMYFLYIHYLVNSTNLFLGFVNAAEVRHWTLGHTQAAHAMLSLVAAVVSNVACRRWHLISLNWNKYITTQYIGGSDTSSAFRRNNEYAMQMIVSRHRLPDGIAYYYYYCLLLVFVLCASSIFRLCSRVRIHLLRCRCLFYYIFACQNWIWWERGRKNATTTDDRSGSSARKKKQ